ncbi:acyltransferase [Novosphingobium sp. MW5]|nr:acyltransferase [Novosphingobium sp. MW5]
MGTGQPNPQERLYGLDALRGIAAMLVVLLHIHHQTGALAGFDRGYLAVDLFLVLSGYVMARCYEHRMAGGMTLAAFMKARMKRLWPTIAIGVIMGLGPMLGTMPASTAIFMTALALLFIPYLSGDQPIFPASLPMWSLFFEVIANAAHHLVFRRMGSRSLIVATAACMAFMLAYAPSANVGSTSDDFWMGFPRLLGDYMTGILIWRLVGERQLVRGEVGLVLLPSAVLATSLVPAGSGWADFLFVYLCCPLIVLSGLAPLRHFRKPLVWLGDISFPLYAVHYPVLLTALRFRPPWPVLLVLALVSAWLVLRVTTKGNAAPPDRVTGVPATT